MLFPAVRNRAAAQGLNSMKTIFVAGAATLLASICSPVPALAGDESKSGHAVYDAYVVRHTVRVLDNHVANGMISEVEGFDRAVSGAPFDVLVFRCVWYSQTVSGRDADRGVCIKTDKDGDTIAYSGSGTSYSFLGGTGKFKGLTGHGTYAVTFFKPDGDNGAKLIVRHEGDWQIQ